MEDGHLRAVRKKLEEADGQAVLLFYRQGNYITYGRDADLVSEQLGTATAVKEVGTGKNKLKSHIVNVMMLESVLRGLVQDMGHSVEVLGPGGGQHKWERLHRLTPGNMQAIEELFGAESIVDDVETSLALKIATVDGVKMFGVAYCDRLTSTLYCTQFQDTAHLTTFESVVVQVPNVRECLVTKTAFADKRLVEETVGRSDAVLTELQPSAFNTRDIEQDLGRLLEKPLGTYRQFLGLSAAMGAMAALLSHLELLGDDRNFGHFQLLDLNLAGRMRLDNAAIDALQLLPTKREANKKLNLLGLLDECVTTAGSRKLRAWLSQPLLDTVAIRERQDLVAALVEDVELLQELREKYLKAVPDISRVIYRLQRGSATLADCCKLHGFFVKLPALVSVLRRYKGKYEIFRSRFIAAMEAYEESFTAFVELVEAVVDMEEAEQHNYILRAEYDAGLQELYQEMKELEEEMEEHAVSVRGKLAPHIRRAVDMQRYPSVGFCFRLSRADEKGLRQSNAVKYHTVETRKDGVKFRTATLHSLSDTYEEVLSKYEKQQRALIKEVMTTVCTYLEPFMVVSEIVAEVDVVAAWAQVFRSARRPFVRPTVYELGSSRPAGAEDLPKEERYRGSIFLKQARHPCLEMQEGLASSVPGEGLSTLAMGAVIANDVLFTREDRAFQIITGPNMGGKSTYIRTTGVVVLMAQIGCFVPCEEAYITCVDTILCRVGAGDCAARGLSTFMSEMLETASIIDTATNDSLVIIDELGRGTSTYDGFGIAWAISEYLCKEVKPYCFFATHFHELTLLEGEIPTVKNLRVAAESRDDELVLLYRVEEKPCDRSFGIHVAKLARFPESVIELAKRKASELEDFTGAASAPPSSLLHPVTKVQKTEEEVKGAALIDDVLAEANQLQRQNGGELPADCLRRLKKKIDAGKSPYIEHVLKNFS